MTKEKDKYDNRTPAAEETGEIPQAPRKEPIVA